MDKNLFKFLSSTAVALAMSSGAVAQQQAPNKRCPAPSFEQGNELASDQFPAAYNAPARIDVQRGSDYFVTGSFTYWDVAPAGFDLISDTTDPAQKLIYQEDIYSPGFKVGLGMNLGEDNWIGFAEYTWVRNHSSTHITTADFETQNLLNDSGSSPFYCSRQVHLDLVDLTLSRPFYEGRKLTLSPSSGIRGALLRQGFRAIETPSHDSNHANSNSWFIGPRAGVAAHWLIGCGLRLESDVGASILFQRYTTNFRQATTVYKLGHQNRLAPVADIGIGLGWGAYLNGQKSHLDFVATYDFMNWWGQNLMRSMADSLDGSVGSQAGGLKIAGLTLSGRFDF